MRPKILDTKDLKFLVWKMIFVPLSQKETYLLLGMITYALFKKNDQKNN